MLFIYGALPVGGIETFFMRMAKERARLGLQTSILLLSKPETSDSKLLAEMKKYATVLFPNELFFNIPGFTRRFPLLVPTKKSRLVTLFNEVDQIHVYHGMHALLAYRLSQEAGAEIPITVGFYHYSKYLWGGDRVAFHERLNREFIFKYLPQESLLFFSEGNRQLYKEHKKMDFSHSNTFRLGVIDSKKNELTGDLGAVLKVVAVGRLVEFKTYNLYMLDIIKRMNKKGYKVQFDIYGDGPLRSEIENKIQQLNIGGQINLKGTLDYLEFDNTVGKYDLFIGSGTAIIQAAALGLPSIVGVENTVEPETYGYFSNVHQYEYNLKGLDLPLFSIEKIIEEFIESSNEQRLSLKSSHLRSIQEFTNESCQKSLDDLKNIKIESGFFEFNAWIYEMSRMLDWINMKINKRHPFITRHDKLKNERFYL